MPNEARFYKGWRIIKKIAACEGDHIVVKNRTVFINGQFMGTAMKTSSDKRYILYTASSTIIPKNKVYLAATHPKSYDSRYASFGLRDRSELLGIAYPLF